MFGVQNFPSISLASCVPPPGLGASATQNMLNQTQTALLSQLSLLAQDNARLRMACLLSQRHVCGFVPPPGLSLSTPGTPAKRSLSSTAPPSEGSATESDNCQLLADSAGDGTTFTLRHVPASYDRERFVQLLERLGFADSYDFLYLPVNFQSGRCLRYAVVNLRDDAAGHFEAVLQGFQDWQCDGPEASCAVERTENQQGLQACIERYRESPVNHPVMPGFLKPILVEGSRQLPLPPPRHEIRLSHRLLRLCAAYEAKQKAAM
jgi:hypothetical protein